MATKIIGKIVLYEALDQDKITDLLAGSDVVALEIERQYSLGSVPQLLGAVLPAQFDVAVLKEMIDNATWIHQQNAIIYKCIYDAETKTFDFSNSYVRDSKDTSGTLTTVTTGQKINAIFTTPGLDGPVQTTVELLYGQAIDSTDIAALTAKGVVIDNINSTGSELIIKSQTVPYRVQFVKPDDVASVNYVIDFNLNNQTIENII